MGARPTRGDPPAPCAGHFATKQNCYLSGGGVSDSNQPEHTRKRASTFEPTPDTLICSWSCFDFNTLSLSGPQVAAAHNGPHKRNTQIHIFIRHTRHCCCCTWGLYSIVWVCYEKEQSRREAELVVSSARKSKKKKKLIDLGNCAPPVATFSTKDILVQGRQRKQTKHQVGAHKHPGRVIYHPGPPRPARILPASPIDFSRCQQALD